MALHFRAMDLGFGAALTILLAITQPSAAAPIVYNVNRTVGAGSMTGTIETDGSTGLLATANVVAWNLQLNGIGSSFNLTQSNSTDLVSGSDLSATANDLLFNFSASDNGYFLIQANSPGLFSGEHYYCDAPSLGGCFAGETVSPASVFDTSQTYVFAPRSGVEVIGTAGGTSVPEPATLALVGLGLGIAGVLRRRVAS